MTKVVKGARDIPTHTVLKSGSGQEKVVYLFFLRRTWLIELTKKVTYGLTRTEAAITEPSAGLQCIYFGC